MHWAIEKVSAYQCNWRVNPGKSLRSRSNSMARDDHISFAHKSTSTCDWNLYIQQRMDNLESDGRDSFQTVGRKSTSTRREGHDYCCSRWWEPSLPPISRSCYNATSESYPRSWTHLGKGSFATICYWNKYSSSWRLVLKQIWKDESFH